MAENQLIITQGGQGLMGYQGPQGSTTFVAGPTGAAGATGIAGIVFPYDVSTGTASFFNVGEVDGQFIMNQNGVEWTGISGTAFPAINYTFISSSQSAAIYYDNVYGLSYSLEMSANNAPAIFNNLVIFAGGVQGASFSGGSTISGPQGPIGPTGAASTVPGPTGPATGWPVDTSLVDAQFLNIGNSLGSFNMGSNGISINGVSSSYPEAILLSNNIGASGIGFHIDSSNGYFLCEVPSIFTMPLISTYYLNEAIIIQNFNSGLTASFAWNNLTSNTTAAIPMTNVIGNSYSLSIDNSNSPVFIGATAIFNGSVIFNGVVSGSFSGGSGGSGATGPQGPQGIMGATGAVGITSPIYYGNFLNTSTQPVVSFPVAYTYSLFNTTVNSNGISLTGSSTLSPTFSNIYIANQGLYYIEASYKADTSFSGGVEQDIQLFVNNIGLTNSKKTTNWSNSSVGGSGNAVANFEVTTYYITALNAGDMLNIGVQVHFSTNVIYEARCLIYNISGISGASGSAGAQGPIGLPGSFGPQGSQGPQGFIGATGIGATGPQGDSGTFTDTVSGTVSFTGNIYFENQTIFESTTAFYQSTEFLNTTVYPNTSGMATLSSGTITILNSLVDANSLIFVQYHTESIVGFPSILKPTTITPGVSFVISAYNPTTGGLHTSDNSVIQWMFIN